MSLKQCVDMASAQWKRDVVGVVYPIFWPGGLTVDHDELFGRNDTVDGSSLEEVARECARSGIELWLGLDLELKPYRTDLVHVVSSTGNTSPHACINTPATHKAIEQVLMTIANALRSIDGLQIRGIVSMLNDLWPISARGFTPSMNCFCRNCRAYIEHADPGLLEHFNRSPNPWDLVLRDNGDGIGHVGDIRSTMSDDEMAGVIQRSDYPSLLVQSGRITQEQLDDVYVEWVAALRRYMRVRHSLTVDSLAIIAELVHRAFPGSSYAVGVTDIAYDWSGGYFLDLLSDSPVSDEIWIDPGNSNADVQANVRYYLMERGHYYYRGFLEYLETYMNPLSVK